MSPVATIGTPRRSRPRLRLLRDEPEPRRAPRDGAAHGPIRVQPSRVQPARASAARPLLELAPGGCAAERGTARSAQTESADQSARVLVAGGERVARRQMLEQLRGLLPEGTPFLEAEETWEVVAQASDSRMVVLTGDLGDLSARGLMRVLSRRHPLLPVIALADGAERRAPRAGAASL